MRAQVKMLFTLVFAVAVFGLSLPAIAEGTSAPQKAKKSPAMKEAYISRAQAEKIALKKVPNGTIKTGEFEKEKGRMVWSFDITTTNTKNVTEVLVNARTGKVISVTTETPAKEAEEATQEMKETQKATPAKPQPAPEAPKAK